ncbi:ty3-gypsy retrotransposon protein [Cucumis melo var. makuwa]|uniref:Ty3-gypsy retrotransposon protein n=1 Tax=Cucumis melo var. makuwa TaxID=1194695 RepID=A0A5D3C109_CUCMM|nr:ty3-gypsy retrotransposon protein [Cucumis melo var. makuwa]
MESLKLGIVLKENPLYDNFDFASSKSKKEAHLDVMSVMMVDITVEVAMAEMKRKLNFLMKVVEVRDNEITALREQMRTHETAESSQTPVVKATDKGKNVSYTKRIDNLRMSLDCQPSKFQQFDGKGNLKQHIASSSKHGLLYILQGIKPHTSEELTTWAHDMELSIASRGTKDFPVPEVRKDKKEMKGAKKLEKSTVKESMVVNMTRLKFSKRKEGRVIKNDVRSKSQCLTLKERQEKFYPFFDSDIADVLEQLLKKKLIQLPKCKRPKQAGKVDDPNYCKYHRVINHPVEKCFVLKELILRLACEKKIELDLEELAQTNHAAVMIMLEALFANIDF